MTAMVIRHLTFTGPNAETAGLEFYGGSNVVWGASNTGKSFALKAINFMLGGADQLPDIGELEGYETIWLGFTLLDLGDFTVERRIQGGDFRLFSGLVKHRPLGQEPRILSAEHSVENEDNLSNMLLTRLAFAGKLVAKNALGVKVNLSFRNLAHLLLVDETSIQAEIAPVERGQRHLRTLERSVFRMMLSGTDDSLITTLPDPKIVSLERRTRTDVLAELIAELDDRIARGYPDEVDFDSQVARLAALFKELQERVVAAQRDVSELIREKQFLASEIPTVGARIEEISMHLLRFAQLDAVYLSDIGRLEALEEAGFLVAITNGRECPLCGADPEQQKHSNISEEAQEVRSAAAIEIEKILAMRSDLGDTITELQAELVELQTHLPSLNRRLSLLDSEIALLMPSLSEQQQELSRIYADLDYARTAQSLRAQRGALIAKRAAAAKNTTLGLEKPNLMLVQDVAADFCRTYADVLTAWEFPGENHVSFDQKTFDFTIDGKRRINNGKGVRAVTHAAFDVALLLFCREKNLPHPGFIVLDTPLLTYRDPVKVTKYGPLGADEIALARTPLRQRFFEHLHSVRDAGQFIIFENVDLPDNITSLARVEVFTGSKAAGRAGLLG
jgi:hypothetical protein